MYNIYIYNPIPSVHTFHIHFTPPFNTKPWCCFWSGISTFHWDHHGPMGVQRQMTGMTSPPRIASGIIHMAKQYEIMQNMNPYGYTIDLCSHLSCCEPPIYINLHCNNSKNNTYEGFIRFP